MNAKRFLKCARVGITVAVVALVIGLVGELAWLALGLPGVHQTTITPASRTVETAPSIGAHLSVATISESRASISIVPTFVVAGVGLTVGFWRVYRRGQPGEAA